MKFNIGVKMPKLDDMDAPFNCPNCKKQIKAKLKDIQQKRLKQCPHCKTPIHWK